MVGGLLLVLGLFTRLVAGTGALPPSSLCLHPFFAHGALPARRAHAPGSLYPIKNHGELAVVLCFVFLYLAVAGGGRLSVDAV